MGSSRSVIEKFVLRPEVTMHVRAVLCQDAASFPPDTGNAIEGILVDAVQSLDFKTSGNGSLR